MRSPQPIERPRAWPELARGMPCQVWGWGSIADPQAAPATGEEVPPQPRGLDLSAHVTAWVLMTLGVHSVEAQIGPLGNGRAGLGSGAVQVGSIVLGVEWSGSGGRCKILSGAASAADSSGAKGR